MSRSPGRPPSLRLAALAAVALLLLDGPGLVLAKWMVAVDFEPTRAVAGEPAELAAVMEVVGHDVPDVPGGSMPTPADVAAVQFRLRQVGDGDVLVVPAIADPQRDGRYTAEVTVPDPGEWRVHFEFFVDGQLVSHHEFPDQQPYVLTVEPPSSAGAGAAPATGTLGVALLAAGAAIGGLVTAYRRRARSASPA